MSSTTVIADWLVDGTGAPPQRDVLVTIEDGRVTSLRCGVAPRSAPTDAVDGRGCTLIPGLLDAHVHLFMEATADSQAREHQLTAPYVERRSVMRRHLAAHRQSGVVAVRDGGDHGGYALRLRDEGDSLGVILRAAGRAWRARGRYGRLIGRPPPEGRSLRDAVAADDAAPDHVKLVNSGLNSLATFGRTTRPQFHPEELSAVVRWSREAGLPVMVHANGPEPVRGAASAGVDSVEHGYFATDEVWARAADAGTAWVPTLAPMWAFSRLETAPDAHRDVARRTLDHQREAVRLALRRGVEIIAGTDAGTVGVAHGAGLWQELRLLGSCGLTVGQVVRAATADGARLLRAEDRCGALREGGPASWVLVEGPPEALLSGAPVLRGVG